MPQFATRLRVEADRVRKAAGDLVPSDVASFVPPRFRLPRELDRDFRPVALPERAAGRAYVAGATVAGTALTLPVSAIALVTTAALAVSAVATVTGALVVGAAGGILGGAAGAVGWLARRNTSPRRGALTGLGFASMAVGLPMSIALAGSNALCAYALTSVSHGVSRVADAAGYRSALATRWTVAAGQTATRPVRGALGRTRGRARRDEEHVLPAAPETSGPALATPLPETPATLPALVAPLLAMPALASPAPLMPATPRGPVKVSATGRVPVAGRAVAPAVNARAATQRHLPYVVRSSLLDLG